MIDLKLPSWMVLFRMAQLGVAAKDILKELVWPHLSNKQSIASTLSMYLNPILKARLIEERQGLYLCTAKGIRMIKEYLRSHCPTSRFGDASKYDPGLLVDPLPRSGAQLQLSHRLLISECLSKFIIRFEAQAHRMFVGRVPGGAIWEGQIIPDALVLMVFRDHGQEYWSWLFVEGEVQNNTQDFEKKLFNYLEYLTSGHFATDVERLAVPLGLPHVDHPLFGVLVPCASEGALRLRVARLVDMERNGAFAALQTYDSVQPWISPLMLFRFTSVEAMRAYRDGVPIWVSPHDWISDKGVRKYALQV